MNKRLRKFLESRGLDKKATEQDAWAFLEKLEVTEEDLAEAKAEQG